MKARIVWARGGEARVVSVEGDAVVLRSTVPSPPGSRIEGILEGAPPVSVRVKVHVSRNVGDGAFELRARLLDASREVRGRLVSASEGTGTGTAGPR